MRYAEALSASRRFAAEGGCYISVLRPHRDIVTPAITCARGSRNILLPFNVSDLQSAQKRIPASD